MDRHSSVVLLSPQLTDIALIHKLRPERLAGLANFIGGKVDDSDWESARVALCLDVDSALLTGQRRKVWRDGAHACCARRETLEESGVRIEHLTHFATVSRVADGLTLSETAMYCAVTPDVYSVTTRESESVFVCHVADVIRGDVISYSRDGERVSLSMMPNLSWLTAMAIRAISDASDGADWRHPFMITCAG